MAGRNGRSTLAIDWFAVARIANDEHRVLFAYVADNSATHQVLKKAYPKCFLRKPLPRRRKVSLRDIARSSRDYHGRNSAPADQLEELALRALFPGCQAYHIPVLLEWQPDEEGQRPVIPGDIRIQLHLKQLRLGLTVTYLGLPWTVVYLKPVQPWTEPVRLIEGEGILALSLAPAECFIF